APVPLPDSPAPADYVYNDKEDHYVAVSLPAMDKRASELKTAIGNFNEFKFRTLGLLTEMNFFRPDQGIIYTKKFKNAGQARIYLNSLAATTQLFRNYQPTEYRIFIISEANYNKLAAEKNIQSYFQFYDQNYK